MNKLVNNNILVNSGLPRPHRTTGQRRTNSTCPAWTQIGHDSDGNDIDTDKRGVADRDD